MRVVFCLLACSICLPYATPSHAIPINAPVTLSPWRLLPSLKTWVSTHLALDAPPAAARAWVMPHRGSWGMQDGAPMVSTPRLDELWMTIDHRRQLDPRWWSSRLKTPRKALQALYPELDFNALAMGQRVKSWTRAPGSVSQRGSGARTEGA